MEAIIFNLIKLSNSLMDLCFLITLSSDNTGAVGVAGFWASKCDVQLGQSSSAHLLSMGTMGVLVKDLISWWGRDEELEVAFTRQYWTTVVLD